MKRRIAVMLVIIMIVSVFTACGKPQASSGTAQPEAQAEKAGGTLIVGIQGDPSTYNPDSSNDDFTYTVSQNIFNRLVKFDASNKFIPDLADSWEVSDDAKVYTFHLAKGVKWHDGQPFTSADVKWTYEAVIQNKAPIAPNLEPLEEIACPDDHTVIMKLKRPDAGFMGVVSWYACFIMPKHIYEGTDWITNPAGQNPIGTGPFRFVEHNNGVSIALEANKDYFRGSPKVDRLIYQIISDSNTAVQAFYNGELDILGISMPLAEVPKMEKTPGIKLAKLPLLSRVYLDPNIARPPFDKLEVRQAVAMAVDPQEIVDKAFKGVGQVGTTFYSPLVPWALNENAKLPDRDIAKAKALLEKAGYKPDKNGNYLSIKIDVFSDAPFPDIATIVQANLKEIGIDSKINVLEGAAWEQKCMVDRDYDLTVLGGYQGPDPSAIFNRVATKGSMNFRGYSNPEVDKLLEEAASLGKQEERGARYKEVQQLLSEDLPIIPIMEWVDVQAMKDYVKGHPALEGMGKASFNEYSLVTLEK